MGKIASADTVYATAYLTEKGRTYLFNKGNVRFDANGNDLFQIIAFGLGDPDTNYTATSRFESGDIPDVTGKAEGCLKSTTDYVQTTLVYYSVDALAFVDPLYSTNVVGNLLTITTDVQFATNASSDVPPVPVVNPNPNTNTNNATSSSNTTGLGGFGVIIAGGGQTDTGTGVTLDGSGNVDNGPRTAGGGGGLSAG